MYLCGYMYENGIGTDTNKVTVMTADGGRTEFGLKSKQAVAADVVDSIAGLLQKQTVS